MKRNYCKPILSLIFAILITLTLLANTSEATPACARRLLNLTVGQHIGLAHDGTYFYVSSRKDEGGSHLRKYDFSGNLIFDVDLATQVTALEYIDNTLYGIQHSEPHQLIIFDNETGGIDSIFELPGPIMDPVGLAKPDYAENEFYVLGYDDSKPFSFMLHVYDENWNYVKVMEYIVGLQVNGTISGLTSIGQVLYITIFDQNLMWKVHPHVEGFVIDIYTLPFIGSAGLATDGTYVYAASAYRLDQQPSIHEISLQPCLTAPISDEDEDGEPDVTDQCPDTSLDLEVDSDGCSLEQFCSGIDTSMDHGRKTCNRSDWKNDEPLENKGDCEAIKEGQGPSNYRCVPR